MLRRLMRVALSDKTAFKAAAPSDVIEAPNWKQINRQICN